MTQNLKNISESVRAYYADTVTGSVDPKQFKHKKTINKKIQFIDGDVKDTERLIDTLNKYEIKSVIHFAALKSVRESVINPLKYYEENVGGTISLLKAMKNANVKNLVFSSSATIYGNPEYLPIDEFHSLKAINPYGNGEASMIIFNFIDKNLIS